MDENMEIDASSLAPMIEDSPAPNSSAITETVADITEQLQNQTSTLLETLTNSTSGSEDDQLSSNFFRSIALDEQNNRSEIKWIVVTLSLIVLSMAAVYIAFALYDRFKKRTYKQTETEDGKEMKNMNGGGQDDVEAAKQTDPGSDTE